MDIIVKKGPWYKRYRYYLAGGGLLLLLLIWITVEAFGPRRYSVGAAEIEISEVSSDKFIEYVEVEGIVEPQLTLKINTLEGGTVNRIVADEGSTLKKGDTILVLSDPELNRTIEDEQDVWQKEENNNQQQQMAMEQKRLALKQQILQTQYELERLKKSYGLDQEEYKMGVKSKAQLEVSQAEYEYKSKSAALQMEILRYDSAVAVLSGRMLESDRKQGRRKMDRARERLGSLVVTAPIDGLLGSIGVTPGQRVGAGESIGEISVTGRYKLHTTVSEYYVERFSTGLPGTINYQEHQYNLRTTKVNPEVKDRNFEVELAFTDSMPQNVRIGKSYRVQIELGQSEKALVLPKGAYSQTTSGEWVYKLNAHGDRAVKTLITVGRQNPHQYEVLEGLKAGDRIISSDYRNFGDAEVVRIK